MYKVMTFDLGAVDTLKFVRRNSAILYIKRYETGLRENGGNGIKVRKV